MALFLVHFEEERVVFDDVSVVQMLDVREVALQKQDVFAVQPDALHGKQLPTLI